MYSVLKKETYTKTRKCSLFFIRMRLSTETKCTELSKPALWITLWEGKHQLEQRKWLNVLLRILDSLINSVLVIGKISQPLDVFPLLINHPFPISFYFRAV